MMFITPVCYFASIHLFFFLSMPINLALGFNRSMGVNIKCVESERQALLSFKQGLMDEYNILSSWETRVNNDCCNWRGVRCSNKTEGYHVIGIDLRGSYDKFLMGQIPDKMGELQSLESLDLSRNYLSGPIPSSFSQISRLGVLKLSYNNLSGKIPTGTQLQGFSTSSYEGNPYLCGDPLKKCFKEITQDPSSNNNVHVGNENENEDKLFVREFMISMLFGFIVGFWGIFGSLVLNRRWRHAYFKFFRCRNN
ncbi:polygalacturonase inhibitor-like [Momordica charantia]|uniref:Polygalacturonase inhibitor-like n=1 Tax=Momordica charantia TaxID=3673 RepID=A0A6J1C3A9_MOMCH|nr:polygalacturonase inhibitor-like [Momordica charantia]